jgi:hypothetical protein
MLERLIADSVHLALTKCRKGFIGYVEKEKSSVIIGVSVTSL